MPPQKYINTNWKKKIEWKKYTGEAEAASSSREGGGDEMVQITVSRGGQLQSTWDKLIEERIKIIFFLVFGIKKYIQNESNLIQDVNFQASNKNWENVAENDFQIFKIKRKQIS